MNWWWSITRTHTPLLCVCMSFSVLFYSPSSSNGSHSSTSQSSSSSSIHINSYTQFMCVYNVYLFLIIINLYITRTPFIIHFSRVSQARTPLYISLYNTVINHTLSLSLHSQFLYISSISFNICPRFVKVWNFTCFFEFFHYISDYMCWIQYKYWIFTI